MFGGRLTTVYQLTLVKFNPTQEITSHAAADVEVLTKHLSSLSVRPSTPGATSGPQEYRNGRKSRAGSPGLINLRFLVFGNGAGLFGGHTSVHQRQLRPLPVDMHV